MREDLMYYLMEENQEFNTEKDELENIVWQIVNAVRAGQTKVNIEFYRYLTPEENDYVNRRVNEELE